MHKIQPRNLSDKEFVRLYADMLAGEEPVPVNWQAELLRRFLMRTDPTADPPLY